MNTNIKTSITNRLPDNPRESVRTRGMETWTVALTSISFLVMVGLLELTLTFGGDLLNHGGPAVKVSAWYYVFHPFDKEVTVLFVAAVAPVLMVLAYDHDTRLETALIPFQSAVAVALTALVARTANVFTNLGHERGSARIASEGGLAAYWGSELRSASVEMFLVAVLMGVFALIMVMMFRKYNGGEGVEHGD